jgi:hypothetical protein
MMKSFSSARATGASPMSSKRNRPISCSYAQIRPFFQNRTLPDDAWMSALSQ